MTRPEADDVALRFIHTADWHLGKRFPAFKPEDQITLSRARLEVLDHVFGLAEQHAADAVLCAGDLFDTHDPGPEWWQPLLAKLAALPPHRPVFLLPGNHDPLIPGSVYEPTHAFRRGLPAWVQVVDDDAFTAPLGADAVLHARPCRSKAGQDDPALALPPRAPGDTRIRIGMVHGSTFDAVDCQTNFPISRDAAARNGFDYLAIGDTHGFRNVPEDADPPVVYPGAPEPTSFGETKAGMAVAGFVRRSRNVTFRPEPVARWSWHDLTVRSLAELRELHGRREAQRWVVRLTLDMRLPAPEHREAERLVGDLAGTAATRGRVGILLVDRQRLTLDTTDILSHFATLPEVLRDAVARLKQREDRGDEPERARAALRHLYDLTQDGGAP
jgi:DNA repair exonuclease SbcCD nuclease subunit